MPNFGLLEHPVIGLFQEWAGVGHFPHFLRQVIYGPLNLIRHHQQSVALVNEVQFALCSLVNGNLLFNYGVILLFALWIAKSDLRFE